MSFNSNAWYSIQNFGNDFFLACQNVGSCVTATDDLSSAELFQLTTINGTSQPYYIRPKALNADANGSAYCVNINTGQPAIAPCSNASAIWGIQNWDANAGDGLFFFSSSTGDSQRLYLSHNESYSLYTYNTSVPETQKILMQWGVSSRGAINDQSYSTVPAAITSGTAVTTTTSSNSTSTSTASTSSGSSGTASVTSRSGSSSITSASPSLSTETMVITPTVTASMPVSTSQRTSSSTVTPTLSNGSHKQGVDMKTVLALAILVPQVLQWLS